MMFGTKEQKEKYLPPISNGDPDGIWCTGYSEPDAGSDLADLQTTAIKTGDKYIVNGQKVWNSAGHRARWCWLACRTNPDAERKHDGLSILIVDMKSPGVTVRPIPNIIGYNYFNEIFFSDVEVPIENLVGIENNGWKQLMVALSFERGTAARFCGMLRRVFDELLVFCRDNQMMQNPDIRRKLAELATALKTLRLLAYESAWKESKQEKLTYEPARDKAFNDEVYELFGRLGTEILGSYAQINPLHNNSRWTRLRSMVESVYWGSPGYCIAAGTTDTMRNIVGSFGLGLPKCY
jgi:alkylation response protein AidB-like acyl-CoA dehydrogenase